MRSSLSICVFCTSEPFAQLLLPYLEELLLPEVGRYHSTIFRSSDDLLAHIQQTGHVDCLVLEAEPELQAFLDQLQQQAWFFPTVILESPASDLKPANSEQADLADGQSNHLEEFSYHAAMVCLSAQQFNQIGLAIDQAISKFIQLKPGKQVPATIAESFNSRELMAQQLRLAEKLKERLDYLGVYYKRNPRNFLRHMASPQKEDLLRQLKADYREIILAYFSDEPRLNDKIDHFVNVAFFADVPISQIVEIHMELMDEFSKHLKLEGRSDEVLLDYRLTLIDTLAHLCEMYRRSIPRES
ncbi:circadian clock protein KaiA [Leptolyngbya sp. NK1-12]